MQVEALLHANVAIASQPIAGEFAGDAIVAETRNKYALEQTFPEILVACSRSVIVG